VKVLIIIWITLVVVVIGGIIYMNHALNVGAEGLVDREAITSYKDWSPTFSEPLTEVWGLDYYPLQSANNQENIQSSNFTGQLLDETLNNRVDNLGDFYE
jgi:hypothetical protein